MTHPAASFVTLVVNGLVFTGRMRNVMVAQSNFIDKACPQRIKLVLRLHAKQESDFASFIGKCVTIFRDAMSKSLLSLAY